MPVSKQMADIYNMHMSCYRKRLNKPYKYRTKFEEFETSKPEEYSYMMKLERILNSNPQINWRLYFHAPYEIYKGKEYFNLQFYTTMAAIKPYNLYTKQLNAKLPDNDMQLHFIKDSLKFIKNFCNEQKISLSDYLRYREFVTLSWATHIAECKVSPYVIIGFELFGVFVYDVLFNMAEDERELLIGDFATDFNLYKTNYNNSKIGKTFIIKGLKQINININEYLKTVS